MMYINFMNIIFISMFNVKYTGLTSFICVINYFYHNITGTNLIGKLQFADQTWMTFKVNGISNLKKLSYAQIIKLYYGIL